jgi:hypothetical protein
MITGGRDSPPESIAFEKRLKSQVFTAEVNETNRYKVGDGGERKRTCRNN